MMKTIFLFLILSALSVAQETKNYDKLYYSSVGILAGTQALDIYSSVGKYEANPIAQGQNQVFTTKRGVLIKSAFMLTVIGVEALILHKKPHWKKELAWFNIGGAIVTGSVAGYNFRNPRAAQ